MTTKLTYIVSTGILFFLLSVGAVSAHTTEIQTFAECRAAGGEVTSVRMLSFPVQTQARCQIDGHIYIEGSDRIIEVESSADASASTETSVEGSEDGSSSAEAEGSASASVRAQIGVNTDLLETLRQRRESSETGVMFGDGEQGTRLSAEARQGFLEELRERRSQVADNIDEMRQRRAEVGANLQAGVEARVEALANGLFERLERTLNRLASIADRIENEIEELEEEGNDLETASEMLVNARVTLDVAETEILEAEGSLEAMLSADEPREAFAAFRTAVREAREALISAKQELMEVIREIKLSLSAAVEAEVEAEAETE